MRLTSVYCFLFAYTRLLVSTTNIDDWPKLLVKFSTFVKLDECGLVHIHWRNVTWEMFSSIFSVQTWHVMYFKENKKGGHTVFHDVNSILYMAYPMARISLKVNNFPQWKRSLIHSNQLSLHPKKYKKQTLRNRIESKMESSRKFKTRTGQKTEKSINLLNYVFVDDG